MVTTFSIVPKVGIENIYDKLRSSVVKHLDNLQISDLNKASIREIVQLVNNIEKETSIGFVRMELGIPGLTTPEIIRNAEIEAIKKGVTSVYPMLDGLPMLKEEISKFLKLFLDIYVSPFNCMPTVGALQGSMLTFMVANRAVAKKEGTLFLDPGFNVHKTQCKVLGHTYETFEIRDFRGRKLYDKLKSIFKKGKISSLLYSNPNNPTWISFSEEELKYIGDLCNEFDVIVIEDMAYFGMDSRIDYSIPGQPPYQPTVAKYTDNYVLLISSSKTFSYAGQRLGMMIISDKLAQRNYPDLKRYYPTSNFRHSIIFGSFYALTAGAPHSPQYGLLAMLKAMNSGEYNIRKVVQTYAARAKRAKALFLKNGFNIVYDMDDEEPIADGFYFTVGYKNQNGHQLLKRLFMHGISALSLASTGSCMEGIRICCSLLDDEKIEVLEERLNLFNMAN